jgi:tetratricopeptide (TPR) repeat protein
VNPTSTNDPKVEHGVRAAQGWFELGLPAEAEAEIALLPEATQRQPEVLKLRFHAARAGRRHEAALELARILMDVDAGEFWGWLYRSQALHWLGRTAEALELLLPLQDRWPKAFEIPYDLACYCAQLGREDEARDWFRRASRLTKHPSAVRSMALSDPDLEPLWPDLEGGTLAP